MVYSTDPGHISTKSNQVTNLIQDNENIVDTIVTMVTSLGYQNINLNKGNHTNINNREGWVQYQKWKPTHSMA